jgi:peptidyl-prolyl cis-trans isomerase SurA
VKLPAESYRNRCRANVRAVCASNTEERQILNSSCIRWFGSGRRAGLVGALAFVSSVATFATFGFDAGNVACAQVVKAPRYTGGVENPLPQLNLPPLPPAITPHGTVVEDVVVRVNDQIITRSDVERAEQQLEKDAAEQNVPASDVAVKQRDMLRDMIDQQLLLSKAKELGLNVDADVIRELDDIRKKNNMSSLEDLERAAAQSGINYDDFKAKIRDQMLTQQVVRDEVGRRLQMSQSDEAAYYQAHLKEYQQPEQIRLSEILVPLPDTATPAEIVQAQKKAEALKTKLTEGGDFADLAKKYSGGPSAAQGGDLGMWKRGALAPVLEQATFSLKAGQSTEPIRTRQGFVILKVTQHDDAGPAPLSAVEPQIQEAMYMNASIARLPDETA